MQKKNLAKKSNKLSRGRRKGSSNPNIITVRGTDILKFSTGTSAALTTLITWALFPRTNSLASNYISYRFTSWKVRMAPAMATLSNDENYWVLGAFMNYAATVSVVNQDEVLQLYPNGIQSVSGSTTANTSSNMRPVFRITRKHFLGQLAEKWKRVISETGNNSEQTVQGCLVNYNPFGGTIIFTAFVDWTCQFTGEISSVITLPFSTEWRQYQKQCSDVLRQRQIDALR
jgi:hypothetical protein